jgi:endonuclease/exonuclease/phosphatase family metal-dependent hydrolase
MNMNKNMTFLEQTNSTFRLVQYNAEWLFIDYYGSMNCPGAGCTWKTATDSEIHLSYVAKVIHDLNPDIVNICEIEGCDELHMLNEQLNNRYLPLLKKGTDTGTGQNVGMLTRIEPRISLYRSEEKVSYPIVGTQCGNTSASGSTGVSKHYITEFYWNYMNVAFIGAHLLAIPTDPSRCVQREAQAQVLQNVVAGYVSKDYEVIVVGDFNDYDGDVLDANSNVPTSRVLNILKGNDGAKKGSYQLTNIAYRFRQGERFSDWWDSDNDCSTSSKQDYSMIDHVLVTNAIDQQIANAFIYHGYDEYCGKWNSDHYPVVVDFIHL